MDDEAWTAHAKIGMIITVKLQPNTQALIASDEHHNRNDCYAKFILSPNIVI